MTSLGAASWDCRATPRTRTSGSTTPPAPPASPPASSTSSPPSVVDRRATIAAMSSVAEPGQAITPEELQLATRNRGMPLEGLRYDVTPVGHALPARPLRHPGRSTRRPGGCRSAGCRPPARAEPRRGPLAAGPDDPRHARMRGQRASAPRAATAQPAVARRGGRHGDMDRHVARRPARRCRSRATRSSSSSPAPTGDPGRHRAGLPAQPDGRGRDRARRSSWPTR